MNEPTANRIIRDTSFEGERPLYRLARAELENVHIGAGESPLKHAHDVTARRCELASKYPFWHGAGIRIEHCTFRPGARAAIWYTEDLHMRETLVEAPKMFRQSRRLTIEHCRFPDAAETLWNCSEVVVRDVELDRADYVLMNGRDIVLENVRIQGNYSFQDARGVTVRNSQLDSKDAFWGAHDVSVYDSVLEGEYLGWHSRNLRLIGCTIRGTQPLCYATNLVMIDCRMEETDLAFEYSTLDATVRSHIQSIKNPRAGSLRANSVGEIILDEHCIDPGACTITLLGAREIT